MRYNELSPVSAKMVIHPGEYQWSSYQASARGKDDIPINPYSLYLDLGEETEQRFGAYRELFRDHLDRQLLHEIRDSLNHELVLGRSYFKDKIEKMTKRQTRLDLPGRPKKVEEIRGQYLIDI